VSRIGRLPITVPAGVQVHVNGMDVHVKGPKGEMNMQFLPVVDVKLEGTQVHVTRSSDEPNVRALHGTTRALISNMVTGVSTGFTRVLAVDGVGYRPELSGKNLVLFVGYSHPVTIEPPAGITFEVDTKARQIKINGFDKEQVGQVAADLREIRPPEPYKGKGIRYQEEKIRRKAGKAGKGKGKK
jgi:large subunit ribosomal protein L6